MTTDSLPPSGTGPGRGWTIILLVIALVCAWFAYRQLWPLSTIEPPTPWTLEPPATGPRR